MSRERLIKIIEARNTKVYSRGELSIYANIADDDITLKDVVSIRVVSNGRIAADQEVDFLGGKDLVKVLKPIIGRAGLTVRDVEIAGNYIATNYEDIKRVKDAERYGIIEIIEYLYKVLEESCITRSDAEAIDPTMSESVLIDKDMYRLKAGVLERIANDMGVESKLLRQELQSLGFMSKGVGRDDSGLSLKGNKLRLLSISRKALSEVFDGDDEVEDQEETVSA